jgi:N-acetylneuraminic acid mutarotase
MNRASLLSATVVLSALTLASCGEDTTQPNLPEGAALRTPEAAVSSGTWTKKQQISPPRDRMAAGTLNNTIYVAGGFLLPVGITARVDAYNVATNTWSQIKSLPSRIHGPYGVSALNGRLYVAGGYTPSAEDAWSPGNPSRALFEYTPSTNSWVRKRPLPASVFASPYCEGGAQGVIGGRLYIYVPCYDASPGGRFFRYDPATDRYLSLTGPPVRHDFGGAGVINGKFYLASGGAAGLNRLLHVYNPATNAWTTKARLPATRFLSASAVLNGKLFLIGGQLPGVNHGDNTLTWYDPATNTWSEGPPMPTPRFGAAAASASGRVYVIGGSDSTGLRAKVEAYTP